MNGNVEIGNNVIIGAGAKILPNVKIGDNVMFGPNVSLIAFQHYVDELGNEEK